MKRERRDELIHGTYCLAVQVIVLAVVLPIFRVLMSSTSYGRDIVSQAEPIELVVMERGVRLGDQTIKQGVVASQVYKDLQRYAAFT